MSDIYISEAFEKVGDKGHFQYGLIDLWEFYCELVEIVDEKPALNYPTTVFRFGNVPLKAPGKSSGGKNSKVSINLMDDGDDFGFDDEFDDSDFSADDDERFDDDETMDFADDIPEDDED